jgi:thiol-disulfide isomerase/thioredoxin
VVGTTFDAVVMRGDRDVLVQFYAPWCSHCQSILPIYEQLASQVAATATLTIAKFDATANEIPHDVTPGLLG